MSEIIDLSNPYNLLEQIDNTTQHMNPNKNLAFMDAYLINPNPY